MQKKKEKLLKMMNNKYLILNLEKFIQDFKNVKTIDKINQTSIKTIIDKNKLFKIQYFLTFKDNRIIKLAFLAKDEQFNMPVGLMVYDDKLKTPKVYFEIENVPFDKLLKALSLIGEKDQKTIERTMTEGFWNNVKIGYEIVTKIPSLIGLYWMADYFQKEVRFQFIERSANTTKEMENNEYLFGNQKEDENPFKVYNDMINYIKMIIQGKRNSLLISGKPGISKSYIVRRTLHFSGLKPGKDYRIEKGGLGAYADLYNLLFYSRKKILVLDDFDSPLLNKDMVNLIKAATDTYRNRIVSFSTMEQSGPKKEYAHPPTPKKFEYGGRMIIITNIPKEQLDTAIMSRVLFFEVKYSTEELMKIIQSFIQYIQPEVPERIKKEVFNYFSELYEKDKNIIIDFRNFSASIDVRMVFPNWKDHVKKIVNFEEK